MESREGEGQRLISQEGGAHSKQLMHWRVKAPQLALMMQSGREEEGPEVLMESAPTYTQSTHTPFLGHSSPFKTRGYTHSTDRPAWTPMHSPHTVPNPLLAGQRSGISGMGVELVCLNVAIRGQGKSPGRRQVEPNLSETS